MKAGAAGGIEPAVKAINNHINNAGVCEHGCWALFSMIIKNGKRTDKITTSKQNEMNS